MSKCIHKRFICAECFRAEKAKAVHAATEPAGPKCLCVTRKTERGTFLATQPDCPLHGRFEVYDPAFAQKKNAGARYHGLRFGF